MEAKVANPPVDRRADNVRAGYQSAVNLWAYEGGLCWARFNVMLMANSIILTVSGITANQGNRLSLILKVMPIVGLVMCVAWFLLISRAFSYYKYWVMSARELEERLEDAAVKTVSRGATFAAGEEVSFILGGSETKYRMSWLARKAKAEQIAYLVISVFFAGYVLLAVTNWS
jgi:phosphate/sulfate permease